MLEVRFETLKNETIMKKVYLHPEMDIVEIKSQALLAGSAFELKDTDFDPTEESLAPVFGEDNVIFAD